MSDFTIYTQLIVNEASHRGISVRGYPEANRNFAILEYKGHRENIYMSMTDRYGQASHRMVFHKELVAVLLREAGFPAPASIRTNNMAEAQDFLREHKRIVVKPIGRSGGVGITIGIDSQQKLSRAFKHAQVKTVGQERLIICQEHIEGNDTRVLVVDHKIIFAAKRIPAHVVGDGRSTVAELVSHWNEKTLEMRQIKIDESAGKVLAEQKLMLNDVPPQGKQVYLSRLANAHCGAIVHDVTDELAKEVKEIAFKIAELFDCPFIGIDFISQDISREPGKIIELNPHAGIALHHFPTVGKPRNVAGAIVDMIFPETQKST